LNGDRQPFELIVIDQSEGPESEHVLREFQGDSRLRYVRSTLKGKGRALNQGLRLSASDIVVCTDDDCEAPPGWVAGMARILNQHPTSAILFCNVIAAPYDRTAGYVPIYERTSDRVLSSVVDARRGLGLGAGMALRREAILSLGGFDEVFGPGARFGSGDDWEISLRALLAGWHIYETASLSVIHHGFRTFAEGRDHARRDWVAIGALCAKPIRAMRWSMIVPALSIFSSHALWPPLEDLLRARRPRGLARISGFLIGFLKGMRIPVDRRTMTFLSAD
jgi:GT2 family glycosyltransferase